MSKGESRIKDGRSLYAKVGDDDNTAGMVGAVEDVLRERKRKAYFKSWWTMPWCVSTRLVLHNVETCKDRNPIKSTAFWCIDTIHTETTSNTTEHGPKSLSHVVEM